MKHMGQPQQDGGYICLYQKKKDNTQHHPATQKNENFTPPPPPHTHAHTRTHTNPCNTPIRTGEEVVGVVVHEGRPGARSLEETLI